MQLKWASPLVFAILCVGFSTAQASGGSLASRLTAAFGQAHDLTLQSKTPGCLLKIRMIETRMMGIVDLSLVTETRTVNFRSMDKPSDQVSFHEVAATSEFDDAATGAPRKQTMIIRNMPMSGISGSTITIIDDGASVICHF